MPTEAVPVQDPAQAAAWVEKAARGNNKTLNGLLAGRDIWLRFSVPGDKSVRTAVSPHFELFRIRNGDFWRVDREASGHVSVVQVPWIQAGDGVLLAPLERAAESIEILGRVRPAEFGRSKLRLLSPTALKRNAERFALVGGILYGSMLVLAAFGFAIAVFNRDPTFFVFSAWLLTSLRVAAHNGGWDLTWLEIHLDGSLERAFLRTTLALHVAFSLALFHSLFTGELRRLGAAEPIRAFVWALFGLSAVAFAFTSPSLMAVIWIASIACILAITIVVSVILFRYPSPLAAWYTLSWGLIAAGQTGQLAYSTGWIDALPFLMNSQVSAIASAFVMSIALAERLRSERAAKLQAQSSALAVLRRFRENYNAMPVGIFSMKLDGTIIEHNPAFGEMFNDGGGHHSKFGSSWADLTSPEALKAVKELTASNRMMDTELVIVRPDGKRRWVHVRAVRKTDRYEGWIEDITARKDAEGQLKFLVDHDSLTGLLNRRGFELHLLKAIGSSGDRPVCLAYVDLDRFKLVNDLFGHAAGDQILRQMATRVREVIRPPHVAARVGGDELVVIMDGLSLEAARILCEKLRGDLSDRAYQYQDKAFNVTASIGVIRILDDMRPADALTASDRACREAKASGGATVVTYDATSAALVDYLDEIKLVAGMKERLPVENFFMQLQPIVSLRNPESTLCYETLIRMRDATGKVLPPARFIPAAERNGLMTQIDRWVLRSTLEWFDSQPGHRDNVDFCTLNLSGASLNDEKFLQDTIALIRAHPESTRKICFEITESVALYDLKTTRRFVDRIKSFGAMVALDDFGAGYTSFSYLKELPGDLVKIDGNFIRDVNQNRENYAITRAVVDLAHELGMGCVAEWAENAAIVKSLIDLQVDYAQGYGICRPLDQERLLAVSNSVTLVQDRETAEIITGSAAAPRSASRRITIPI